jgi:lysophospholipid acyltransferase
LQRNSTRATLADRQVQHSVGLFYLIGLFDLWRGTQELLLSAGTTYAVAYFLRGSPYMPWIGFVQQMGHLSFNHIKREVLNDPSIIDITFSQMVMVMKLTAFCWNVADGVLPDDQLSDLQKEKRLKKLPGLLDYTAYVLFFPALIAGPSFDYADYQKWIDTTMFDLPATTDPAKKPPVRKKRRIPRSATPALLTLSKGLLYIAIYLILSTMFPWSFTLQDGYMEYSFPRRVFFMHMMNVTARTKYYGTWAITEGACILAGLGYNGIEPSTGRVLWNRLQNVDAWGVELAQNARAYLDNWNMNTNKWLRNYIYLRVTPRGKKPGFRATMATFITSAFWHGFNPGYYLTFVLAGFLVSAARSKSTPTLTLTPSVCCTGHG